MKSSDLLKKIENARRDLIEAAAGQGYSSKETIRMSRHLDDLLNQYEKEKELGK